ncbi:uncharacterized protein LOC135133442 [Zophobas morio]|uniref:uncharacterized protein LOC135133442 n=1 Tax=Zophobas morio TaxID=2755281 RepID=UPI003082BAE4
MYLYSVDLGSACLKKTSNRSVLRRTSANMFRVQWHRPTLFVLCFFLFLLSMPCAVGECWYKDELHAEGTQVITPEPCLNCTCNKGALLCYLRVCPTLPNPPPPGCILLHKFETCCPELICSDGHNYVEARSDPDEYLLGENSSLEEVACVVNGSVYGPGSAMDSSTLCEYCYCLGGKQVCVSPKCLLPIEDCRPKYDPSNCCPTHYECNHSTTTVSTTTKSTKLIGKHKGGCVVDGVYYKEGDKVLGAGHSECDNCYCLRGVLRCEPLACAPALFGCVPVVRKGECCAVSYNCSGTIETNPQPNYADVPIVSQHYAKFHKEFDQDVNNQTGTILNYDGDLTQTTKIQRNTDSVIDDRFNRKIESNNVLEDLTTTAETTTDYSQTTFEYSTVTDDFTETTLNSVETDIPSETTAYVVTVQTVLNSTDCIKENNSFETEYLENDTNTQETIEYSPDVVLQTKNNKDVNATVTTVDSINHEKNTSTDIFNKKDTISDYEYDYNEPSLPPSLPNLRIIPFLAADALDLKNSENGAVYSSKELVTDSSYMNYNLFSPPVETEGGFIPKEPPILDNVFENTIASTTNLPKLHEISCLLENLEIPHGDTAPAQSPCETCRCFYGNVVCQKIKCPGPQFGCKGSLVQDLASCCPHYVCDNEVPDRTNLAPQSFYFDKVIPTTEMTSTKISMSSLEDLEVSTDSTSHYSTTPTVFITTNFKSEGKRSDVGHRNSVDTNPNLAVLKLAGCNIYGRMYRVGRIISELSNPCLECKCTEIGVQCKTLKC